MGWSEALQAQMTRVFGRKEVARQKPHGRLPARTKHRVAFPPCPQQAHKRPKEFWARWAWDRGEKSSKECVHKRAKYQERATKSAAKRQERAAKRATQRQCNGWSPKIGKWKGKGKYCARW